MSYPATDFPGPDIAVGTPAQPYQLSPLTTGQILDRTFVLFRSRFTLFAALAVFPAAVALLVGLAQIAFLLATHTPLNEAGIPKFTPAYLASSGISLVGLLLRLCVYGISIAATNWCVAKIYLGEPATMKAGFDFAFRKWFKYVVMELAQGWFAMWLPTLVFIVVASVLGGLGAAMALPSIAAGFFVFFLAIGYIVWVIISFIRVSLAIPACVVEELPIRASIRRSRTLLVSRKIRIFLLFLFIIALEMVFLAILIPLAALIPKMGPNGFLIYQLATLAVTFVFGVLVSPIAAIGLCLFYFDERVRREGFDIEFLLSRSAPPESFVPPAPPTPEAPPALL